MLAGRCASPRARVSCQVSQKLRGSWSGLNRKSASPTRASAPKTWAPSCVVSASSVPCGSGQAGIEKRDQARIGAAKSWMSKTWPCASRLLVSARASTMSASSSWARGLASNRRSRAVLMSSSAPFLSRLSTVSPSCVSQKRSSSLPPDSERPVARRCSSAASRERRSRAPKRVRFIDVSKISKGNFTSRAWPGVDAGRSCRSRAPARRVSTRAASVIR